MARMIPDNYPTDTQSCAERRMFDELRDGLGDEYTVIHSLPWLHDERPVLREGECDFVILHPKMGLLALEAKSGQISYSSAAGQWHREDGSPVKDPFAQAQGSAHYLNALLAQKVPAWEKMRPTHGHAVALPDARQILGGLLPHMTPDIIIMERDLEKLESTIEKIFSRFSRTPSILDGSAMRAILDVILPEFQIVLSLKSALDQDAGQLVRLKDDQYKVLESMHRNKRLLIEGTAGSGKTLLAAEKASRVAEAGQDVLFLCFNNALAEVLEEHLARWKPRIDVRTFHGVCREVVRETGGEYAPPSGHEARQEFYNRRCPELLLDALPEYGKRYDAILVDEAQDFEDDWWVPIDDLLRNREESLYYVFLDPSQNIYRRKLVNPFKAPEIVLPGNCRNTQAIANWIEKTLGMPVGASSNLPSGRRVVVTEVEDGEEEVDAVRKTLHLLVREEGITTDRIAILGRHKLENSAFARVERLGNLGIVGGSGKVAPGEVRYSTIHSFKGLEADCVFLTGIGEPSDTMSADVDRVLTYVGASRARLLLHVFLWGECSFEVGGKG